MLICCVYVFGEYTPHSTQLSCSTVRYHRAITRESARSLPQLPHLKQEDIVFVVRINHYQVFHVETVNALSSLNSTQMWNLGIGTEFLPEINFSFHFDVLAHSQRTIRRIPCSLFLRLTLYIFENTPQQLCPLKIKLLGPRIFYTKSLMKASNRVLLKDDPWGMLMMIRRATISSIFIDCTDLKLPSVCQERLW